MKASRSALNSSRGPRAIKGVDGIHIMAIEWEQKVSQIVETAGLYPRPVMQ